MLGFLEIGASPLPHFGALSIGILHTIKRVDIGLPSSLKPLWRACISGFFRVSAAARGDRARFGAHDPEASLRNRARTAHKLRTTSAELNPTP